jgi:hypothetical protein
MTITPRREAASRTQKARNRRRPNAGGAARHVPAVRARPRHAAEAVPDAAQVVSPEPPATRGRRGSRRAPARRAFLATALLRCALYVGPLGVAVAAAGPLDRIGWPVPLVTLLLGWTAAQALTGTGVAVARRAGPAAACRLVGAGFAAVAGLWCALVWVAPAGLLGGHRALALVIGLGGLATLATVTAALVTRSETAIVRWSLPCWLLGGAAVAGAAGGPFPELQLPGGRLPVDTLAVDTLTIGTLRLDALPLDTLLPAVIVLALVRAFRPAIVPGVRGRPARVTRAELRRGIGYMIIGASQAICVGLLWRAGSAAPFWLPLLLAVPILETLIGWHTGQAGTGLAGTGRARGVALVTLAGLVPPLVVGGGLAFAAYRLPAGLAGLPGARDGVLSLAGGTLLGGVIAITSLFAARGRTGIAATIAAAPPMAAAALRILPVPDAGPLPDAVAVLGVTHLAGLIAVALIASGTPTRNLPARTAVLTPPR